MASSVNVFRYYIISIDSGQFLTLNKLKMRNSVVGMVETQPKVDRFDPGKCDTRMTAVVTSENGGYDRLMYCEVPVPKLEAG